MYSSSICPALNHCSSEEREEDEEITPDGGGGISEIAAVSVTVRGSIITDSSSAAALTHEVVYDNSMTNLNVSNKS